MGRMIDGDSLTKRLIEFCNKNCPYTAKARDIMCGSCFMGLALEAVEDAPTIDSELRWISCKERLPEDDTLMLVNYIDSRPDAMDIWIGWHEMENVWYIDGEAHSEEYGNEVIAWMPLPEPWKEGEK